MMTVTMPGSKTAVELNNLYRSSEEELKKATQKNRALKKLLEFYPDLHKGKLVDGTEVYMSHKVGNPTTKLPKGITMVPTVSYTMNTSVLRWAVKVNVADDFVLVYSNEPIPCSGKFLQDLFENRLSKELTRHFSKKKTESVKEDSVPKIVN
jgi:hypothetical protein